MILGLGYKKVILYSTVCILLVLFIVPKSWIELVYGNGIYLAIRSVFHLLSFIPFPLLYLLLIVCIYLIYRLFNTRISIRRKAEILILALGSIILLFYVLWAFNYRRPAFGSKFPLEKYEMDSTSWNEEIEYSIQKMVTSRPINIAPYKSAEIEFLVRSQIKKVCNDHGYAAPGKIRVKTLWPKGFLLRISTAGFYLPYTGEAYVDKGLLDFQIPYTLSHEMCHGYGMTDEGACNYLAYLALINHPDSSIQYSAHLAYFRYVAGEFRFRYPEAYKMKRDSLPYIIINDLNEINANFLKYPDIMPRLRDLIYDNYLQVQGIKEGMASYDNIIGYVRQNRLKGLIK